MDFRSNRRTIDAIYVLRTAIEKSIRKEKGKLVNMFADQKAAFDNINRKEIWETMVRKGIKKAYIKRVKNINKEIYSKVQVKEI